MADKEVELPKSTAAPSIRSPNKLSTPSRMAAYALGLASLGAGGVAVFVTQVEAGPVALLFVGLIFMIIALSGRLPTRLKFGDNYEAEWQEVAGNVIETALDAASPSTKAEVAVQLNELAEVAPRAAAPALSGFAFENSTAAALAQAVLSLPDVQSVTTSATVEGVGEFDFVLEATDNRFILIEVKGAPRLSTAQVAEIMGRAYGYRTTYPERKTGLLLVSRHPLSAVVRAMFMQTPDAACIVFRPGEDDGALISAINGLLSTLGS